MGRRLPPLPDGLRPFRELPAQAGRGVRGGQPDRLVQGLPGRHRVASRRAVRHAADVRRGGGRARPRARSPHRPGGGGRTVPGAELWPRHAVDDLRPAGVSPAARHVDGAAAGHPRRPRVGCRWLAAGPGEAFALAATAGLRGERASMRRTILAVLTGLVLGAVSDAAGELRGFVTNEKSDDVTVIQASTGTVVKTIAVGKRPRGVAASLDGKRVYVANSNSDSLSVIDTTTLSVIETLPCGRDPEGLAFNRAGTLLYVVNENDSSVTVVEVASSRIVKKIEVGTEPETAVASPDGRWIAVSNETSNDVHVIETASNTVVKKIAVPKNPRGMRFTADSRRLFVASEQAHVVSVVDMATFTVQKSVPTGGSRPVDVALSPDGKRAWVSHGDSRDLRVLDAGSPDVLATIPVGPRPWWTALTPDGGRLYVTVGRAGDVAVVDTAAGKVIARIPAGKLPWGIALVEVP